MGDNLALSRTLAASIRHGLLPRRFPVRRDIELAGAVVDSDRHTAFFYSLWPSARVLVLVVASLEGGSIETGLKAAALRELLHAVLHHVEEPADALDAIGAYVEHGGIDLAIARIDFATHALKTAFKGHGAASGEAAAFTPDAILWLHAGDIAALEKPDPNQSLGDRVAKTVASSGHGAGFALLFKADARDQTRATFSLFNEQLEIPRLIGDMRRHAEQHGVPEAIFDMLDIALDEVLSNCINYGFRDSALHEIIVEVEVEPNELMIEIRDDGIPFDPLSVPQPDLDADIEERQVGGLGMHFVRTLLDNVFYERRSGWNVLRLVKTWQAELSEQSGRDGEMA